MRNELNWFLFALWLIVIYLFCTCFAFDTMLKVKNYSIYLDYDLFVIKFTLVQFILFNWILLTIAYFSSLYLIYMDLKENNN
jgi:hypothetical protein